jgi:urea transport system substrate-binding protein
MRHLVYTEPGTVQWQQAPDPEPGIGDAIVGEEYVPFGSTDVDAIVKRIAAAKPDVILSSVVGDSGLAFARSLRAAGMRPEQTPVVTFAFAENELATASGIDMVGDYAAWNYFQSIDRPENRAFVTAFKSAYGADRTTSDVMVAAYDSVRLWAQAVREAGTADVRQVRSFLRHQSLAAPEGVIAVDPETQHTWRPVFIGRIRADGQFDVVWSSRTAVRPVPFPISRSRSDWESALQIAAHAAAELPPRSRRMRTPSAPASTQGRPGRWWQRGTAFGGSPQRSSSGPSVKSTRKINTPALLHVDGRSPLLLRISR